MEHKILIMCMLMMLFLCKKRDKLIFRIIKEVEGIKKVQYLCLEKKTGLKYIQEYIGDTLLERKYYLNSKNDPEGECIYYDSIGNIEQKFYINKNGEIDGLCTFYYPSGKISEIHYYDNGVKGLQEYYLENGFLKCVYYFDGDKNKMVHKKNIIIENGVIKDTIEKLFPIIKFEKDTVRVNEEFSVWFKRPKSKYISDKSHWAMVYDLQNITYNKKYVEPDEELILDTVFEERRGKLSRRGKYVFYYDIYKDSILINSNSRDIIYVK